MWRPLTTTRRRSSMALWRSFRSTITPSSDINTVAPGARSGGEAGIRDCTVADGDVPGGTGAGGTRQAATATRRSGWTWSPVSTRPRPARRRRGAAMAGPRGPGGPGARHARTAGGLPDGPPTDDGRAARASRRRTRPGCPALPVMRPDQPCRTSRQRHRAWPGSAPAAGPRDVRSGRRPGRRALRAAGAAAAAPARPGDQGGVARAIRRAALPADRYRHGATISGLAAFLAVAAFVGGFVVLVLRMDNGRPPDSGSDDDGAVV